MKGNFHCGAIALATILFGTAAVPAIAQQAPAVSAPNAKIEFDAGALNLPAPAFLARAAGTVTVPIGERFGLQADLGASTAPGFVAAGALHLFTRDPASYLIGGTFGFVRSPGATVLAAGPEAELYLDRWTVEAWGGIGVVRPIATTAPNRVGPFIMVNAAYYVTDNWRLNVGVSWLDGYGAAQVGSEYLVEDFSLPLALTTELRFGQDGSLRGMGGLRAYLGPDAHKSLMLRHRQDDPSDRSAALYAAAGPALGWATSGATGGIPHGNDADGSDAGDDEDTGTDDNPACELFGLC